MTVPCCVVKIRETYHSGHIIQIRLRHKALVFFFCLSQNETSTRISGGVGTIKNKGPSQTTHL